MTDRTYELHRAKTAAVWVGTLIPLSLTLIATVIVAFALPRLPAQVAIQFSFTGTPGNFGPAWMQLVLTLGVGGLLSLLSLLQMRQLDKNGQVWGRTQRFMPALMLGIVAMIQIMAVGTTLLQVGLSDARDMPNPSAVLLAAFIAWPVLSIIGYAVQPKLTIDTTAAAASRPLTLARGERVVWVGSTALSRWALIAVSAITLAFLGATLAMLLLGNAEWWIFALVTLILAVSTLLATVYRVRIDRTGLTARSPLGWPVFRVPATDIERVTVGTIEPFGEFGGWGVRSVPGTFALALRTGPGLRVRRRNGRTFVITLNADAETAASVLATAAESSRA